MKDSTRIICAAAIMLGLMVVGFMMPQAVKEFRSYERTVNVKGLCEREVPADKVIWPMSYNVVGDDIMRVYSEIETKNAVILKFLKDGGIDPADVTVGRPSISDKFAQEYGSNDRMFRYVSTNVITVCSKDVDKVLALMADQASLIKDGITFQTGWNAEPTFSFEGLNDIKPEMIEEATKNAREAAQKFASDSGSRIGKIKEANQGTFSISDRDSNTPQIKSVRVVTYVTYYLKR